MLLSETTSDITEGDTKHIELDNMEITNLGNVDHYQHNILRKIKKAANFFVKGNRESSISCLNEGIRTTRSKVGTVS